MRPDGAHTVRYAINLRAPSAEGINGISFSASVDRDEQDEAARAGAEAIIASFQAQYPEHTILASREYECHADGDAWPTEV